MSPRRRSWLRETALLVDELAAGGGRGGAPWSLPATLTASQLVRLSADPAGLAADLARPMPRRPGARPVAARRSTPGSSSGSERGS